MNSTLLVLLVGLVMLCGAMVMPSLPTRYVADYLSHGTSGNVSGRVWADDLTAKRRLEYTYRRPNTCVNFTIILEKYNNRVEQLYALTSCATKETSCNSVTHFDHQESCNAPQVWGDGEQAHPDSQNSVGWSNTWFQTCSKPVKMQRFFTWNKNTLVRITEIRDDATVEMSNFDTSSKTINGKTFSIPTVCLASMRNNHHKRSLLSIEKNEYDNEIALAKRMAMFVTGPWEA